MKPNVKNLVRRRIERASAERALQSDKNYQQWRREQLRKGLSQQEIADLAMKASKPVFKTEKRKLPPKLKRQSTPEEDFDRSVRRLTLEREVADRKWQLGHITITEYASIDEELTEAWRDLVRRRMTGKRERRRITSAQF